MSEIRFLKLKSSLAILKLYDQVSFSSSCESFHEKGKTGNELEIGKGKTLSSTVGHNSKFSLMNLESTIGKVDLWCSYYADK